MLQYPWTYIVLGYVLQATGTLEPFCAPTVPALSVSLLHLVLAFVVEDTLFYWTHRFLHQKFIYAKIHKKHHQFTTNQ